MTRKRILCVGLIALDIVNTCERYPDEDEDIRAISQRWQTGGNACTNSTILTQLGIECEFLGSMSQGVEADFVCKHLRDVGVAFDHCVRHPECGTPTSFVTLSLATGSRTVVHARNNLPELPLSAFQKVNLSKYSWVHFEGRRNESEITEMIAMVDEFNSTRSAHDKIMVSVELEKPRQSLLPLLDKADVVFTSKDFARFCGYSVASEAVKAFRSMAKPGATVICAWGEEGADGIGPNGEVKHSDAFPPKKVIDTLGAGDTFVAGAIYSLLKHPSVEDALNFACKLAGFKCGMPGNNGLVNALNGSLNSD
ncbi:ketohexokinase-like [Montipora capricornis]|uniref:ketohexokinase-like n=1 Tax=Montipora foliosa TaxID=591990 RepID=UPI0035F177AF